MSWSLQFQGAWRTIGLASVVACSAVHAQEPAMQYHVIQAVVDGLRSPGQCAQIDQYLRAQADVIVARTDYNTRNVMLQVPHFSTFTREHLRELFAGMGLEVRCYRRHPLNSAVYEPLDPRTCTDDPTGTDE